MYTDMGSFNAVQVCIIAPLWQPSVQGFMLNGVCIIAPLWHQMSQKAKVSTGTFVLFFLPGFNVCHSMLFNLAVKALRL